VCRTEGIPAPPRSDRRELLRPGDCHARSMERVHSYHVVPHSRGWAVRKAKASRASVVFTTKAEAVARGRELAKSRRTELVVHDGDAKVSNPNSYGGDSRRHRDKRR
jgi:hypothetical protein